MSREKVMLSSRVRIEKYNENMELEDVHESKVPNVVVSGVNPSEQGNTIKDQGKIIPFDNEG